MKEDIPRLTKTDNPDWDCLIFRNELGKVNFELFPAAEHVLYDKDGMPVDVLPWPSLGLGLEQVVADYKQVSHDVADKARRFLLQYSQK